MEANIRRVESLIGLSFGDYMMVILRNGIDCLSEKGSKRRQAILPWVAAVWMIGVFAGFTAIWTHASTPGETGSATDPWPKGTPLVLDTQVPTMVVFIHPECPCARATLAHLASIIDRASVVVSIVSMTPPVDREPKSDLAGCRQQLETLATHPLVTRIDDIEDSITNRFGASTSGDCFLYSTNGNLMFRGGVTASRGHLGDNAGLQLVVDRINDPFKPYESFPVFGCPLTTQ
ncbi:MAG TPA: hypothetical protein DDZ51_18435 [Planctomycetaceae bacterium]|nr:hypothetical protein [Planctomycetaceae bacterium]